MSSKQRADLRQHFAHAVLDAFLDAAYYFAERHG